MEIIVEYNYYLLKKIVKKQRERINIFKNFSLNDLIVLLQKKYGEDFRRLVINEKNKYLKIPVLINGLSITSLEHILENRDKIMFIALTTAG